MTRRQRHKIQRVGRFAKGVVSLVSVTACVWFAGYIYAQLDDYKAYRVYSYTSVPDEVCPLGAVQISLDRFYDADVNVVRIRTRTGWQLVDAPMSPPVGQQEAVTEGDALRGLRPGRHTVKSSIIREIPTAPGDYRIVSDYDVTRRIFMFYPTTRTEVHSERVLTVLPIEDPRCLPRASSVSGVRETAGRET